MSVPALDVAPRLEHREHPVELAGEALGAAGDPPLLPGDVALEPVGGRGGAQHPDPVGRLGERMCGQRAFELLDPLRGRVGELVVVVGKPQAAQRVGGGPLEPLVVGAERPRQLDGREPAGPVAEVLGSEAHEVAPFGEREHAVAAPAAVLLQHDDAATPARRRDHVAGTQRLEPRRSGRGGGPARPSRSSLMARYSSTSPRSLFARRLLAREQLAVVGEVPLERDDVAVGVVLREREVQQVAGLLGRVPAHEVDGHVVGGPERRRERVGAPAREPGDLIERHVRVPEHDDVADVVDAAAAGAPRELRVLAGREELVVLAGELRELLDDDRAGRHVDAERQRLGGEHRLHEARGERLLDGLLHRRDHAGVVRGEAREQAAEPRVVAEGLEVVVVEAGRVVLGDPLELASLGARREPQARRRRTARPRRRTRPG